MRDRTWKMEYNSPAEVWNDAIPLGNGRLGAMVYGQACVERIQLNEDSLWYGDFTDRNNRATKEKLPLIQQKVLAGEMQEAEDLIAQYLVGAPNTMRHYEPSMPCFMSILRILSPKCAGARWISAMRLRCPWISVFYSTGTAPGIRIWPPCILPSAVICCFPAAEKTLRP